MRVGFTGSIEPTIVSGRTRSLSNKPFRKGGFRFDAKFDQHHCHLAPKNPNGSQSKRSMYKRSAPLLANNLLLATIIFAGCAMTASESPGAATSTLPEVTHDGLVRVPNTRAGAVWKLPEADLSIYKRIALLEPDISFRKNWRDNVNSDRMISDRITAQDMEKIIAEGKKLLLEEFTKELEKSGFAVVLEYADDIMVVRPVILNLEISAPDTDNTAGIWGNTYTDGGGAATLVIELYDSVTKQILVRASDSKSSANQGASSWMMPRSQGTNIAGARNAFADWAGMLVKGLKEAQAAAATTAQ